MGEWNFNRLQCVGWSWQKNSDSIFDMKNAVLLYGRFSEIVDGRFVDDIPECNPNNENNWMGWTKKELEKQGYHVTCPVIPKVWEAPYSVWKKALDAAGVVNNAGKSNS